MRFKLVSLALLIVSCILPRSGTAQEPEDGLFQPLDVFQLEYASDPQISADGNRVVYVRNFMDIMHDRRRANLWLLGEESGHRPLTTGNRQVSSPRWSPDGSRLIYVAKNDDESSQIFCRWMDTGETAELTRLTQSPKSLAWSPDGKWIAFSMLVPRHPKPFVKLPQKPAGAEWAEPAKVIHKLRYRSDGQGYAKEGYHQLFVLSSEGGTPKQLTTGPFDHEGMPSWTPDSDAVVFSANRSADWEYQPVNSEVYQVTVDDRVVTALTSRDGPDSEPVVSPDGEQIAYLGFDDARQGHQTTGLYIMARDGSQSRLLSGSLDRDLQSPRWSSDGQGLYFQYDDQGNTKIGFISLDGLVETVANDVGGTTIGRPYASGSFSVSRTGRVAYTVCSTKDPANVAVASRAGRSKRLTNLNGDLLGHKTLGEVQEIWYESSFDGRRIHGWIAKPPGFDPQKKYPLILEIHGGPFANYGDRFSAEIQLYAAAGYVVFYANPRGSTGYGEEFGNLIHYDYPGRDYDDLMSGVDAVIDRGAIDKDQLYVTGGSGGGILTAWIVGKTGRFRAAVAAKPVVNWISFVLTTDLYPFFTQYWFPGFPWEHPEHYLKRSPLSLVGNVTTPTMLMTGEVDYRTPISESEQFYQALKLRKIDTTLVRIPGASHGIVARPSNLISKVAHILKWFELHKESQ